MHSVCQLCRHIHSDTGDSKHVYVQLLPSEDLTLKALVSLGLDLV